MLILTVGIIFLAKLVKGNDTSCAESQKLYADLCFSPTPTDKFDINWAFKNQPAEGWYSILSNDVTALHAAEIIKGKLLEPQNNYDDMCWKIKLDHGNDSTRHIDGTFFGYNNLLSNYSCEASKDFIGVLRCDERSSTTYKEGVNIYHSYADNVNLHIVIECFPNGQVGWHTMTITRQLSEEERKITEDHVTSLGFPAQTIVETFNKDCPN